MLAMNLVVVGGNLTRDPSVRTLPTGSTVCELSMALNRKFSKADGTVVEETTYVDIEVWGKQAEICSTNLTKGQWALVEGRLRLDTWEDKETKQRRSKLKVVANRVNFGNSVKKATTEEAATEVEAGSESEPF